MQLGGQNGQAQTASPRLQQLDFVGMNVTGDDLSLIVHVHASGKGLAAGSGTAVQNPLARLDMCRRHGQAGCRILDVEIALLVGAQPLHISGTTQQQAAFQPGVTLYLHPVSLQLLHRLVHGAYHRVHLGRGGGLAVVCLGPGLHAVHAQHLGKLLHQPPGVAGLEGDGLQLVLPLRRRQRHVPEDTPEHTIDHPSRSGIAAVLFGQLHAFIYRRTGWNLVHIQDLIQGEAQNGQHLGFQFFQATSAAAFQIPVQGHPGLEHTKAQPGGQGGIPTVQGALFQYSLQMSLRPGPLLITGCQGQHGRFSGRTHR